jgi:hypothetical protein
LRNPSFFIRGRQHEFLLDREPVVLHECFKLVRKSRVESGLRKELPTPRFPPADAPLPGASWIVSPYRSRPHPISVVLELEAQRHVSA